MKELRCLVFSETEATAAVLARRRRVNIPVPAGQIRRARLVDDDGLALVLGFTDDDSEGERQLRIDEQEILTSLINYCIAKKIPMPVQSERTLRLIGGAVALMITMNFNKPGRLVTQRAAPGDTVTPDRVLGRG